MRFFVLVVLLISTKSLALTLIGEEVIKPIEYPKVIFMGSFSNLRYAQVSATTSSKVDTNFGGGFGIDVGLYKYLNAGALFTFHLGNTKTPVHSPIFTRLTLFARPQITFFDRLNIFTRIGGGPSVLIGPPINNLKHSAHIKVQRELEAEYAYPDYSFFSPGLHGAATVGVEYFPWNRCGFALEWGIFADYFFVRRSELLSDMIGGKDQFDALYKGKESFGYFTYQMPLLLSINVIF